MLEMKTLCRQVLILELQKANSEPDVFMVVIGGGHLRCRHYCKKLIFKCRGCQSYSLTNELFLFPLWVQLRFAPNEAGQSLVCVSHLCPEPPAGSLVFSLVLET